MIKKTVVIIGASSEIGLETAKIFAEKGYSLALTFCSNEIDFEKELKIKNFKAYKLDLKQKEKIATVFNQIGKDFDYIDSLVFVAGKAQKRNLIVDVTDQEIDDIFEINTLSAIRCIREFCKLTVNKNPSNIVLVGSFVEKNGCSCESVYTASKSALSGLCKSLSSELGNLQVRINVVAPGFIDTKMNNNLDQEEKDEIASMTPIQRLGKTSDVASLIYFLNSENSSFITGQTICVDGGLILE